MLNPAAPRFSCFLAACSVLMAVISCGGQAPVSADHVASTPPPPSASRPALTPCVADENVGTRQDPVEPPVHIPLGSPGRWLHDPPTSGQHWAKVPPWGVLAEHPRAEGDVLVPEWYVSSIENGGVAVLYRDPASWQDVAGFIRQAPIEASVQAPKLVDAPYPTLTHPYALAAWGWLLYLDRLDDPLALKFYLAHVDHGPAGSCP